MKKTLIAGMLMVMLAAALLAGCSQQAVNPPGPKQPATLAPSQPAQTAPASADTPVTAVPADNGTAAVAAAPVVAAAQAARIAEILQDPKGFDGKTVIVEGKIASECPSGCWFTLKDGNATIYIDLNPSNLVIPQRKGSFARVTARVMAEGSDVYLIGTKVDF